MSDRGQIEKLRSRINNIQKQCYSLRNELRCTLNGSNGEKNRETRRLSKLNDRLFLEIKSLHHLGRDQAKLNARHVRDIANLKRRLGEAMRLQKSNPPDGGRCAAYARGYRHGYILRDAQYRHATASGSTPDADKT